MNHMLKTLLATLLALCAIGVRADEAADKRAIVAGLEGLAPGLKVEDLRPSPLPGIYELALGAQVVYVSADGRYLIRGDILDLKNRSNLTRAARARQRLQLLAAVPESRMLVFAPKKATRHTITVFTDVDCPYCRKLHAEVGALNDMGIRVRYLLFPRTPPGSPSFRKAVSVWCSATRKATLERAMEGMAVPAKSCSNPIARNQILGDELDVHSTPTIVTEQGMVLPGYVSADRLAHVLDGLAKQAPAPEMTGDKGSD